MGYVLEKRGERVRVLECGTLPAQSIQELTRKDVGTGISLFHLIRTDFDKALLANCLSYINREGAPGIASSRSWKLLLSKMKDMSCTMTPAEKRWAAKPLGKMQNPKGHVGVFRSAITEDLWLGILDGCDRLSSIVMSRAEKYQHAGEFLLDLARVSELGEWGRTQYASKIFELYYGTDMCQEVAYECCGSPYICVRDGTAYWGAVYVKPMQIFPVVNGKEILLLKNLSSREILAPVTGCVPKTLSRPQLQGMSFKVEVLDRMHAEYRYP